MSYLNLPENVFSKQDSRFSLDDDKQELQKIPFSIKAPTVTTTKQIAVIKDELQSITDPLDMWSDNNIPNSEVDFK